MIRQDYILRLVAEMVQVLARVFLLKSRREYEQALDEINAALKRLRNGTATATTPAAAAAAAGEMSVEDWIGLCRKHRQAASGLLVAVSDLLGEQGDLLALQGREEESGRAYGLSLGLLLEALLGGETFVSAELLAKVDRLQNLTCERALPGPVRRRLVYYFEARGRFATCEDLLFAWLEQGEPEALKEGKAFYERLLARDDAELERGDLPRVEAEQGRREFLHWPAGNA